MISPLPGEVGLIRSQTLNPKPQIVIPPRWEWVLLVLILCLAAALRLWRLDSVPPGLTHDEAGNGHDAAAVLQGVRPIYFAVGYGHEPFYPYSVALVMALLGPTDVALRLTTVGWGMALVFLCYGFSRRLFGPLPALLAAVWMATSFWCVMTSRVGLRAITLAVTFSASALCFWLAFPLSAGGRSPHHRWIWWVFSGVFLGASIYTYMASRAMPAVYLLFLIYLLVLRLLGVRRSLSNQQWLGLAALLLTAVLVAAPLVHFLVTHPEAEQRIGQLNEPLQRAAQGDFSSIWHRISSSLPMFTFRGDPLWLYNIPGRPLLDPVSGALFYAGIFVCLWRWRDPRYTFLLLWLIVGVGPALVTGPDATGLRSIAAQPVVFVIVALSLEIILRVLCKRAGQWGLVAGGGIVAVLITGVGLHTAHDYFSGWGEHRDVRVAYHHALVQEVRYLNAQPDGGAVAFSSIYPGRFHDPYTVEVTLHREDMTLRWFDGRFALVFPFEGETRVVIPSIASLDESLEPIFQEYATHIHTENLRPDDLVPYFDVYRFDAAGALTAFLPLVRYNPAYLYLSDMFPADESQAAYEALAFPIDFGGVVELAGYDLHTPVVEPGGEVQLLTIWRVRAPLAIEAVVFTHLLDDDSHIVGQMDRLDVPSWHWRTGDVFVQLHRFQADADAPPGLYHLEVGLYTRENQARLPVLVDGIVVDDRVLLQPVEIVRE